MRANYAFDRPESATARALDITVENHVRPYPAFRLGLFAVIALMPGGLLLGQTVQEHVHAASHGVMPFDMSKTVHIFKMTDQGGVESVITKDPSEAGQVAMIRRHLQHEAMEFQRGNYSDPAILHGSDMPGLSELRTGASQITVTYSEVANGAAITFGTRDIGLITAIHRWFGAQLSEHGADARAE
jgi:hypothetical protein